MASILLLFAALISVAQIAWALRRQNGVLEYPFLIGWVYLGWVLPQAYRLIEYAPLRPESVERLLAMVCIASTCGFLGYTSHSHAIRRQPIHYRESRLMVSSYLMVAFGAYFYWRLTNLPTHMIGRAQWSGAPVMYLFLSSPVTYGAFLALAVYLRSGERRSLIPFVCATPLFLQAVVISGRRGPTIEIALGVLSLCWFIKGWKLNKWLCLAAIPIATIAINGIGIYRGVVFRGATYGDIRTVLDAPLERVAAGFVAVANRADELIAPRNATEVLNAGVSMQTSDMTNRSDLGLTIWNSLISRYFPGQIFGHDTKASLMVPVAPLVDPRGGYRKAIGTTDTGLADSYASFWFLGGLNFLAIGWACRWLWESASARHLGCQLAYAVMIRDSLEALTHTTHHFLLGGTDFLIFLGPALFYAKRRVSRR